MSVQLGGEQRVRLLDEARVHVSEAARVRVLAGDIITIGGDTPGPSTALTGRYAQLAFMDRTSDAYVAYLAFFGLEAPYKVLRSDPANPADRGIWTWNGSTLVDQVAIFDGTHTGEELLLGLSFRESAGLRSYGERYTISQNEAGDAYLQEDGAIVRRVVEHEGNPNAHRFAIIDGPELLDDAGRQAIDSGWPDGTIGVSALGGSTAYTFCAGGSPNTVVRTTIGGSPFESPTIMNVEGVPESRSADCGMVLWDDTTGLLAGFVHWVRADGTSGLALMTWDGDDAHAWQFVGEVVSPNRPVGAGGSPNNSGSFQPIWVKDGYVYAGHRDQLATGTQAQSAIRLAVSRVGLRDMFDALALGDLAPWSKRSATGWDEPGIEGVPAELGPPGWQASHVNAFTLYDTGEVVLFGVNSGPLQAIVSTDCVTWSDPVQIELSTDHRHPYATFYSGVGWRPNEVRRGDTPVLWTVQTAVGETAFQDDTTVIKQHVRGYTIDMPATPAGSGSGALKAAERVVHGDTLITTDDGTIYVDGSRTLTFDNESTFEPGQEIRILQGLGSSTLVPATGDKLYGDGELSAVASLTLDPGTWYSFQHFTADDPADSGFVRVILGTSSGGSGDVVGPASATDGAPVLFDGTTGKLVKAGATNTANGLLKLDGSGLVPDSHIGTAIARNTEVTAAVSAHAGATDPHGDRSFTTSAISTHSGAADPHGDRSYASGLVTTHAGATDPHGDRAFTTSAVAALSSVYQPLDSDLTAIAALSTTSFGRARLTETSGWVPVSDTVVSNGGSGVASISVSASGYRRLRIGLKGRSLKSATATDTLTLTVNSDTGNHYSRGAGALTSAFLVATFTASQTNTDRQGATEIIIDCGNSSWTNFKAVTEAPSSTATVSAAEERQVGIWNQTSAVTSFQLAFLGGNIADGSSLTVEGWA